MNEFKFEPAAILYGVNALVALLVAYGLDLTAEQTGAITTIATAVLAIATAITTRPIVVSTITGAVASLLAAVAAFGLELSPDQIGATVTVLSIVLALALRANVSPAVSVGPVSHRPPVG